MAIISDGFFREGMGGAPVSASYLTTAADGTLTAEVVLTATQTELNYVSGVTSALQTQLGNKAASSHTHAQGDVTNLTTDLGNKQAADAGLTSLAALPTAADKIAYSTAADTWAEATITAAGLALIDDANAAAQLATLGAMADAQPAARAYNSANISCNNVTWTPLTMDSDDFDTDTIHSTTSNTNRMTFTTAGKYTITCGGYFASNATGIRQLALLDKNGNALRYSTKQAVNGGVTSLEISVTETFAAADWVYMEAYQTSGGALSFSAGSANTAWIEVVRVSL